MRQTATGKGYIPLLSLVAIWSISLVVDLPGLAVAPLLGQLDKVFPSASEFEIQMLSALPNICIIPFILLSGRLSVSRSKLLLVKLGLALFLVGGIVSFVAESIDLLIFAGCLVGIGCGLVIPLAAGLLAEAFSGPQLTAQLGIKSGIANATLIFSTFVVGALSKHDWHLPFVVYMLPLVPLLLSPWLPRDKASAAHVGSKEPVVASDNADPETTVTDEDDERIGSDVNPDMPTGLALPSHPVRAMWSMVLFYFAITLCTVALAMYTPFLMQHLGMSDNQNGLVNSTFYLFITLPGFFLPYVVRAMGRATTPVSVLLIGLGSILFVVADRFGLFIAAAALLGFGYGVLQPMFYTKAARLAPSKRLSSLYLSYILAANYLGTALVPFFFGWLKSLLHLQGNAFPFLFGALLMAVILILALVMPRRYAFRAVK